MPAPGPGSNQRLPCHSRLVSPGTYIVRMRSTHRVSRSRPGCVGVQGNRLRGGIQDSGGRGGRWLRSIRIVVERTQVPPRPRGCRFPGLPLAARSASISTTPADIGSKTGSGCPKAYECTGIVARGDQSFAEPRISQVGALNRIGAEMRTPEIGYHIGPSAVPRQPILAEVSSEKRCRLLTICGQLTGREAKFG